VKHQRERSDVAFYKTTVFDLILPRIFAGERPGKYELAELGQGGLSMKCVHAVIRSVRLGNNNKAVTRR
jgi:hypothetical protein